MHRQSQDTSGNRGKGTPTSRAVARDADGGCQQVDSSRIPWDDGGGGGGFFLEWVGMRHAMGEGTGTRSIFISTNKDAFRGDTIVITAGVYNIDFAPVIQYHLSDSSIWTITTMVRSKPGSLLLSRYTLGRYKARRNCNYCTLQDTISCLVVWWVS